jgi:hypothetical protein
MPLKAHASSAVGAKNRSSYDREREKGERKRESEIACDLPGC